MLDNLTQEQFNQVLHILLYYKKCCPEKDVFLTVASFKEATTYFQSQEIFLEDNELDQLV